MATFIPDVQDPTTQSQAEVQFFHHLKEALPDEYHVFHSVPYLLGPDHVSRPAIEGEIDFLIAHAEYGLLAVEVKGGGIAYVGEEGQWYSQGRDKVSRIKDPFQQAQKGIKDLIRLIHERQVLDRDDNFAHGHAVAFPQCEFRDSDLPANAAPGILIDARHLENLEQRIELIFKYWRKHRNSRPLNAKKLRKITQHVLAPKFRLAQPLAGRFRWEDQCLLRLTAEQSFCLDFLVRNPFAHVEGSAGTGKTIVALDYARVLVEAGRDVLFLCFNKPLGAQLKRKATELQHSTGSIWAGHFHGLCEDFASRAGIDASPPEDRNSEEYGEHWNFSLPVLLIDAAQEVPDRFDAIIVDEAQDFEPEWWEALTALWKDPENQRLAVFSDPLQNIYRRPDDFACGYPVLPLRTNCRNTRQIADYAACLVDAPLQHSSWSVPGEEPKVHRCKSKKDARGKIEKIVEDLLKQELKPEQITILSTHRFENSSLAGVDNLAGAPVEVMADDWSEPARGRLGFSTLHRFKGLDSDVVIFIDVDGSANASPSHQYVAASRAKHRLFVVGVG